MVEISQLFFYYYYHVFIAAETSLRFAVTQGKVNVNVLIFQAFWE